MRYRAVQVLVAAAGRQGGDPGMPEGSRGSYSLGVVDDEQFVDKVLRVRRYVLPVLQGIGVKCRV